MLGVSPDTVEDAARRSPTSTGCAFTLLSDLGGEVAARYGVWVEQSYEDATWWGNERSSVLVDPDGKIARVFPNVKPAEHDELVLAALHQAEAA